MGFKNNYYYEMVCPGGEPVDIALLEILTELDKIHPLRSLEFKPNPQARNKYFSNFLQDYMLRMITQLKHLETFSCGFYLNNDYNGRDDVERQIGPFCDKLRQICASQDGSTKKSFKFAILDYKKREKMLLPVEWQKVLGPRPKENSQPPAEEAGSNFCSRMDWLKTGYYPRQFKLKPAQSLVLDELITSGQRKQKQWTRPIIIGIGANKITLPFFRWENQRNK